MQGIYAPTWLQLFKFAPTLNISLILKSMTDKGMEDFV